MAFQFMCPYGHLLQAEESQAGQQCQCPECGVLMVIPTPAGMEQAPSPVHSTAPQEPEPAPPPGIAPGTATAPSPTGEAFPAFNAGPDFSAIGGVAPTAETPAEAPSEAELPAQQPKILHIPCPQGHVLETPEDMVGQDALCPYCNLQFRLRYDDSLEYKREQEEEAERRQRRTERAWFNWSIAAAVVVVLGVVLLFIISASR